MNAQFDEQSKKDNFSMVNSLLSQNATVRKDYKNAPAVITLLQNGMILACNKACGDLLGVAPEKLVWQPISRLLPQLADVSLMLDNKINPYLKFLSVAEHHFDVVTTNGAHIVCELFFSVVDELGKCCLQITLQPFKQRQAATLRHMRTY